MRRTSFLRRPLLGVALSTLALWLGLAAVAQAQQPSLPRLVTIPLNSTKELSLKKLIGKTVVDTPGVVSLRVDEKQLNVLLVTGINPGQTVLTVTSKDGLDTEIFDLVVVANAAYIQNVLRRVVPTANVELIPSGNSFVIAGTVSRAEDVVIVENTVKSVIGTAFPGRGAPTLINALRVGGVQQVQLDVVVAQVDRSRARNIGFSFFENSQKQFLSSTVSGGGSLTSSLMNGLAGTTSTLTGTPNVIFGVLGDNGSFTGYLNALKSEGVAKTLAEPKLVTLSGRPATFISGGEQAVPTLASGSAGGGAVSGISFIPFGTTVRFLPIVQGNGKIYLEVEPQVTFPSGNAAIASPVPGTNGSVAGRTTQRVSTSILIDDGQTFAIGGLILKTFNANTTKVPVLGDLPFIGAAFRTTNDSEDEQELIILVTPHLVDPLACNQLPKFLPGEETRRPDDFELYLEGILEAPRGPRQVCNGLRYVPAFRNSATMAQYPCAGNGCGICGGNGCANCGTGNCSTGNCGGQQVSVMQHVQPLSQMAPVASVNYQEPRTLPVTHQVPALPVAPSAPVSVPVNDNPAMMPAQLNPPTYGEQR